MELQNLSSNSSPVEKEDPPPYSATNNKDATDSNFNAAGNTESQTAPQRARQPCDCCRIAGGYSASVVGIVVLGILLL